VASVARRTGIADVVLAWSVLAVVAIEVFVTYTRTPIHELYHVRHGGAGEGLAATLGFIGFPCGLVAIGGLAVVVQRLPRRAALLSGIAAALVVAGVLWPGALGEAGLETRPARLVAATGLAFALALTVLAARARGVGRLGREPFDRARLVLAPILLFAALPWLAANLGLSLDRVPGLNAVFLTDVLVHQPGVPGLHQAVHDGHHHGLDGVLLALAALLLSRTLRLVRSRGVQLATGFYLSFLLVYGLANATQDFWLEQIVKRGWTTAQLPMVLAPSVGPGWGAIVALTLGVFVIALRVTRSDQSSSAIVPAARAAPRGSTGRYCTSRPISSTIAAAMSAGALVSKSMQRPAP
jgi:hypothetical protein